MTAMLALWRQVNASARKQSISIRQWIVNAITLQLKFEDCLKRIEHR